MYSFCRGVSSVQDEANSLWVWTLIPSVCLVFEYPASIQVFCSLVSSVVWSRNVEEISLVVWTGPGSQEQMIWENPVLHLADLWYSGHMG